MPTAKPIAALAAEVRQHFEDKGVVGSTAIARKTKLGQPQVHRNLYGRPKRISKTLLSLCEYAKISVGTNDADPRDCATLMDALSQVWDGSEAHARKLAKLLFAHHRASM